jgi:polysaccharide pyruvyl transferase WcaK-like protein
MKVTDILRPKTANDSLLIGYYGGGNYGDELLLEVIQNLCQQAGVEGLKVAYQHPENYATYHHEFGYSRINLHSKLAIFRAVLGSKRVIIGGGGLWGLDFAFNVFLLSFMLFLSRWLFGKKVYLIGVGYYNSTTRFGHIGAWLAAKSARRILARDQETFENFRKLNRRTHLDTDIAWYIEQLDLGGYKKDVQELDQQVHITDKTLLIALRRFQAKHHNNFTHQIESFIQNNPRRPIVVTLMEPEHIDPEQYALIKSWEQSYPNVQSLLAPHNPLSLLLFFQKHATQLALIAPQFHAIITAHLSSVPFMPIVYDNKVAELLKQLGRSKPIPSRELSDAHLQSFANNVYGETA